MQKPTSTDETNGITLENNPEAYEEVIQPFDKNTEYFDSEYNTMGKYLNSNTSYPHDYEVTTHVFTQGSTSGSTIYKLKTEKAAPTPTAVGGRKRRNKTNKRINKKKRNTKKRR
jgi:hypothetical protein